MIIPNKKGAHIVPLFYSIYFLWFITYLCRERKLKLYANNLFHQTGTCKEFSRNKKL